MASVHSLGRAEPAGLAHAIAEGILPPNLTESSYTWEIIPDSSPAPNRDAQFGTHSSERDRNGGTVGEDELLVTEKCVIWSRGGLFRKSFRFDLENESITQALITLFPASEEEGSTNGKLDGSTDERNGNAHHRHDRDKTTPHRSPKLAKALIVFLKTQAHIFFLSGTSHTVHMPFEVESAVAAPVGVIIQRKAKTDNLAAGSLKFPKVPPNSFVSNQIQPSSLGPGGSVRFPSNASTLGTVGDARRGTEEEATPIFNVEGLGKPKKLPLRLSSTLENMWQPAMEGSKSHWPRLLCLTDPLLELGLVIAAPEDGKKRNPPKRRGTPRAVFLDPAEEILHIERLNLPPADGVDTEDVILAITANRETNIYKIYRLTYLPREDPFLSRRKKAKADAAVSRRRSSMPATALASGAASPVLANLRESFGAPLPGKRKGRKSEKGVEGKTAAGIVDNIAMSLEAEKVDGLARRQSRRVSSLLARADLSTSQTASFADASQGLGLNGSHIDGRRVTSHGSQRGRVSSGRGRASLAIANTLDSLLEAPTSQPADGLLDELRADGDFEGTGFHHLGLDDHDPDSLSREISFTEIHSVPMDNTNVRYSLSSKPAKLQSKVFILVGPTSSIDEQGRIGVLVGVQDGIDQRLQLLNLHVSFETPATHGKSNRGPLKASVKFGQLRRAQSVVDSCKIFHGPTSLILILSEDKNGQWELSLQAPWCALVTVTLPPLKTGVAGILSSDEPLAVSTSRKGAKHNRQPSTIDVIGTALVGTNHATGGGIVDLRCRDGSGHRISFQLRAREPLVQRVIDVCQSVLPPSSGERMLAGWWHAMRWLNDETQEEGDERFASPEWSALVVTLFTTFLGAGKTATSASDDTVSPALSEFDAMMAFEAANSSVCAPWMTRKPWQWILDDVPQDSLQSSPTETPPETFLTRHIRFAKAFMASSAGHAAIGPQGYLPTASSNTNDVRRSALAAMMAAMHLLLEELKLDVLQSEETSPSLTDLRSLLLQLARWLRWREHGMVYELGMQEDPDARHDMDLTLQPPLEEPAVFDVFTWVQAGLTGKMPADAPPTLEALFDLGTPQALRSAHRAGAWAHLTPRILMFKQLLAGRDPAGSFVDFVAHMHECGFTLAVLQTLPEAVAAPLQDAIYRCQPYPPMNWSSSLLKLVDRADISLALKPSKGHSSHSIATTAPTHQTTVDYTFLCEHELHEAAEDGDGLERQAVVHALFADRRLNEAQTMLTTSKPRTIRLNPSPQWTEPQYLEKQKDLVTTVASETLAVPPGRGLLYYALKFPLLTQKFQIGGFVLNCRVKPTDVMVGVDKSLFTEDKVNWAFFHQGVAAGLAISPEAKGIDTSWILYNKPAQELTNRHAGFLLALGLNGLLKSVAKWVAFKYLTPKHTMTSIGLLLGLAVSYMGTMDGLITRLLSVHVTRMLPRGAADLNLSHQVQTTGVMGIGLLYCGSQHRRMSEIMLSEIAFTGDNDDEDPLRGEGYRLAAGFALGLINLGKGGDLKGLRDMRLTEQLLTIATATKKVELVHILDRSAAAAVMAIALIFMKTEDGIVARKIDVPDSLPQFDYVRPDILLLRTVAKNLILWRRITPTREWIKQSLPREYQWRHTLSNTTTLQAKDLAFFSVLTGLCWSISLRYAGSADPAVRDLLLHYLDQFARIAALPSPSDSSKAMGTGDGFDASLARANARMCLNTLALSAATVMAGTGDLAVMRRLRALHGRTDADVTYGSHMAAHLAVGVLFLGCGTTTFGNREISVASLLMAFYPIWPGSVQDCGAHLQAFRHFWVLAVEERCVVARDRGGGVVRVPLVVTMKDRTSHTDFGGQRTTGKQAGAANKDGHVADEAAARRITTPHLLPPLDEIASIRTEAASLGFWDLELNFKARPELRDDFRRGRCTLWLKRRPVGREENTFEGTMRALGSGGLVGRTQAGGGSVDAGLHASSNESRRAGTEEALQWVLGLPAFAGLSLAESAMVLDCMGTSGGGGGDGEGGDVGGAVDSRLVLEAGLGGWDRSRVLGMRLLFAWGETRARRRESEEQDVAGATNADSRRGASEDETGWWMRDVVIESLKGRVLAASREE